MAGPWQSLKEWAGYAKKERNEEVNRSHYSLVSAEELTEDTLKLWVGLPDEVKNDPALAPFRQLYEKEYGTELSPVKPKRSEKSKKIHPVKSAPILIEKEIKGENFKLNDVKDEIGEAVSKKLEKIQEDRRGGEEDIIIMPPNKSRVAKLKHYTKMTLLLGCWTFLTVVFILYNEKEDVFKNSAINPGETKSYALDVSGDPTVLIKISGPFQSENAEMKLNSTELVKLPKLVVWLERWKLEGDEVVEGKNTKAWKIILQHQKHLDFNDGEMRSRTISFNNQLVKNTRNDTKNTRTDLNIEAFTSDTVLNSNFNTSAYENTVYVIRVRSTSNKMVPFTMSYSLNPLHPGSGVVYALILLCGLYILIIFEVINRTMAAIIISTLSLAVLSLAGERPTIPEVISWLDIETLILLFSMMILVAIMAETGIFDFLAVFTFEVTKGKLWPLIFLLGAITAVVSTFLDNVTTVLLMSPVTIRLCEVMDLDPVPILIFMAIYSNVGGTATPVGDPPCVIVASNKAVIQSGINFTNFTAHMALGIFLVALQTTFQIRFMFRDTDRLRLNVPRDIQDLRNQISIWKRAAESLPHLSKDVHVVRERLERKMRKLSIQLDSKIKESSKRACPKDTYESTLLELKDKYKIRDRGLLIKTSASIFFVVALFFLHGIPEMNRISLGWTALLGAILLLILADREDLEPILHRVEWSTLLFFASLFVLMEALSKLGLILYIGGLMEQLILRVDEGARLAVAIVLIIWVSGFISAFVDNIPLTTMMVRVVVNIGSNPILNLPMAPLIWSLLYGACLGGNGTLIAASANVVCAGVAEQHGYKFTFMRFFSIGFPIMIGHLLVSTLYLLICHCVFTWH